MPFHIVVTVKQVPDPDIPPSHFRVDEAARKVVPPAGVSPVMNGYDANALEEALRLKETHGGKVTVVSVGPDSARDTLQRAIAMGADAAVPLNDPRLAEQPSCGPLTALLVGNNIQGLAPSLGQIGVERVLVADSQTSLPPPPQWVLAAAEKAARQIEPDVILLTHAGVGRELGASLAYRLDTGVVTDCTALRVDSGELVIAKPVFGGSAIAEFSIESSPRVATLRPHAFEAVEAPNAREAQVEPLSVDADA